MKSLEAIKKILANHKDELGSRFYVKNLALFGSYARGDQTSGSDLDILVELSEPMGWEIVDLHAFLESIL